MSTFAFVGSTAYCIDWLKDEELYYEHWSWDNEAIFVLKEVIIAGYWDEN